jgi:hypothetical protein
MSTMGCKNIALGRDSLSKYTVAAHANCAAPVTNALKQGKIGWTAIYGEDLGASPVASGNVLQVHKFPVT